MSERINCPMKENVIVYGAGLTAKKLFGRICGKYTPLCFLDRDPKKQGRDFCGLPVLAPEDGLRRYPNARILPAVSHLLRFDVTDWLLRQGVPVERIIGVYGPVEQRRGCVFLEQNVEFWKDEMRHCCSLVSTYQLPFVTAYGDTASESYDRYVANSRKFVDMLQEDGSRPEICGKCRFLKYGYWPQRTDLDLACIAVESPCNYNCSYCGGGSGPYGGCKLDDGTVMRHVLQILDHCERIGVLSDFFHIWVGSGEPALHPMIGEIAERIKDRRCTIATNASVYSEQIAGILRRGMSDIRVSIDAGTPETYAKIRGTPPDMFERVWEDLSRYAKLCDDGIELQYIVLPGRNTGDADIDGFCTRAGQIGCRVLINRDRNHIGNIDRATAGAIFKMRRKLEAAGIQTRLYSDTALAFSNEELMRIQGSDGASG